MRDPTHGLFKIPTKEERVMMRAGAPVNPLKLCAMLTPMQWAFFFSGWFAWTMDAWDFFSVSLSVSALSKQFELPSKSITTAITLTLLFRSVGALVFGVVSDRYGRKYPLVINLLLIAVLSLGSGFVQTYSQFFAVRSLFGIFMGGVWGLATATALENMPPPPRGLFSGILQQGYAVGYLLSASVNLTWVERTQSWRILFFLGAGLSAVAALVRLVLPESDLFLRQKAEREAEGARSGGQSKAKIFLDELKEMLKTQWVRCIHGILLMTGMNFLSHGSQDLLPSIMKESKLLPSTLSNKVVIIANCGAVAGGLVAGYISQYLGRRLTIIMFVVWSGCMIPAWILPNAFSGLAAGAFFIQVGVQGAWGVIPIYLSEIAPPAFRATYSGLAYQLGNAASSASSQIEATGGEKIKQRNPRWTPTSAATVEEFIPAYAKVSAILIGAVCAYLIIVISFGREYRDVDFAQAAPATVPDPMKAEDEAFIEHVDDKVYSGDVSPGSEKKH